MSAEAPTPEDPAPDSLEGLLRRKAYREKLAAAQEGFVLSLILLAMCGWVFFSALGYGMLEQMAPYPQAGLSAALVTLFWQLGVLIAVKTRGTRR